MKDGLQDFLLSCGNEGCYALCIIKLAENITRKKVNLVKVLEEAVNRGYVYYNWKNPKDTNNFYVEKPHLLLSWLSGLKFTVTKMDGSYTPKKTDVIVERWERVVTGKTISHFRLHEWDSLYDSQTVKFGKIASYRLFTEV